MASSSNSKPYLRDLQQRGFIQGLTHLSKDSTEACHYFGGIPYALPPIGPFRWKRPRPLPPCYRYGTKANPGKFDGGTAVCPQPAWLGPPKKELWDEDCLQLNIYIPPGTPPKDGWPVFVFIHGGFLQFGQPNGYDFTALIADTDAKCVIVAPAYRLNIFGFLASRELEQESVLSSSEGVGNYGFWDQRLALEWTWKNISYFDGDASNITLSGHSAGAYSVFHQLSHDLFVPENKRIIKRAILFSNGPSMQPKFLPDVQTQFDDILTALKIPLNLSNEEKLKRLRNAPATDLVEAAANIPLHEFRGVSDDDFVKKTLFQAMDDGTYAQRLREAQVEIMLGECRDEHYMYAPWRPPKQDSIQGLSTRLKADYPIAAVDALLPLYCPNSKLPTFRKCTDFYEAFGHIYADLQVFALERGFVNNLAIHGAGNLVHRYRIEWRSKVADVGFPPKWGVTHGTDLVFWFWGQGHGELPENEKQLLKPMVEPFWAFIRGEKDALTKGWGVLGPKQLKVLKSDGTTEVMEDSKDDWERGLKVWQTTREALAGGATRQAKL